ncbi:MAG: NAD(P)/FAD-dependent oxidoreductase [Thermoanaerobaculia bacterium]
MSRRRGTEADLLIVGGGPAGLATAIAARLGGLTATVLDRARPPIDKPCGEGLMPAGVERLEALGVRLPEAAGRAFRGIRYRDGELVAEAEFPGSPGLGLRRTILHGALARRAEEVGVDLRWETMVRGLARGGVTTEEGVLRGRWLVGADGLSSRMRRWAGLDTDEPVGSRRRFGVRRHFRVEPWTDKVEVWWADGVEAYLTPVAAQEIGVAMLWSGQKSRFDRLLRRFPVLAERLAGAEVTSRDKGAGPLHRRPRRVWRDRLLLVGDAAGYVDAITGEGLDLAFHQSFALVEAVRQDDPRRYARFCRRLVRLPFALIHLLLFAERRPALRRRLIRTLAEEPQLFERLLAIHTRARPPRSLGLGGVWRLARGLARP